VLACDGSTPGALAPQARRAPTAAGAPAAGVPSREVALFITLAVVSVGCGASRPAPPPPVDPLRWDCSVAAPCDQVRQHWFVNEAKDAELMAAYCQPPAPGNGADCAGLEAAIDKLHNLNVDYFSEFCSRFSEKGTQDVFHFVGRPDRDETAPCGSAQCRVWIWYWFSAGNSGAFTILFHRTTESADWQLRRCNYCTLAGCSDLPP
jgi:hypothetical protein